MKPWYKSKTIWFNAIIAGLAALEPVFPLLRPMLGETYYPVLMVLLTTGNGILRVITKEGINAGTVNK